MSERGKAKDRRHVVINPRYALKSKLQSADIKAKAAAGMAVLSEGRGTQDMTQRLGAIEILRKLLI
jgi:predicted LPLAT superfamily acyltransferase